MSYSLGKATIESWITSIGGTDVSAVADATTVTIVSSTGADGVIPAATIADAGVMTAADKSKLIGIAAGANLYVHPNHGGDLSGTGDGNYTIATNAIDNTKTADMAAWTLKGRNNAAPGDPEDILISGVTEVSPTGGHKLFGWDGTKFAIFDVGMLPTGGGGEANDGVNIGATGEGIYDTKAGISLQFKKLLAASTIVDITSDATNVIIDVDPSQIATSTLNNDAEWSSVITQAVIWHDNFQSGELPISQRVFPTLPTLSNTRSWFVVSTPEDESAASISLGDGALDITLPNGVERLEVRPDGIAHPDFTGSQGAIDGEYWYLLDTKLDSAYPTGATETGTILFQHLTNAAVNPSVALYLFQGEYRLAVRGDNGTGSWVRDVVPYQASYAGDVGNWVRWAIRFKQGQSGVDSPYLELWKDGVQVYSETDEHIGWLQGETLGPVWKFGTYAYGAGAFDHIISYRNAAILDGRLPQSELTKLISRDGTPASHAIHRWQRTLDTFPAAATKLCDIDISGLDNDFRMAKLTATVNVGHSDSDFAVAMATRTVVVAWNERAAVDAPVILDPGTMLLFADDAGGTPNFVIDITDLSFSVVGSFVRLSCTADTGSSQAGFQYDTRPCEVTLSIEALPAGAVNLLIP